ncbi:tripartite tricarboxylate transporter permease [Azospirillum rugosum]|uniref:TctA family transporter n=1 Tax=Azospirillum rugosum TaxID=416170 RepID=A0ABS4SQW9_9PROT|nr:tripartite tricarboxylate transporter permease [Azospirillum rugosum]MBP2294961.1 TctA family transporter [Azospirillum rugosum]MDQ0530989.1 TctA family transporter [Azospirillum rugosum]
MDLFSALSLGFGAALQPVSLLYCFIGVLCGTLVGVLPGIGPMATIAMLLPVTFGLDATSALIMLAGIYYGAQYGGSTSAVLVNLPGETSSVVTCLDGYKMARQGRAGAALGIAAIGSFAAGCFGTALIALFAPPLAQLAIQFGPAEYCALMVLGLIAAVVMAQGSLLKAIAMIVLGLLFGTAGTDVNSGYQRFTFGLPELAEGVDFVVLAIGLFGLAEIMVNVESKEKRTVLVNPVKSVLPTRADLRQSAMPILRGTMLGSVLGVLPGGGALLSSFASYTLEKNLARDPSRFGNGAIEGVAGPEAANNAGAQTSFIPMLTLGLPSNGVMALMIGAMIMQGIVPGPQVVSDQPRLFWGMIASMWVGNLMLVVLNLPLIGLWVKMLSLPYRMLSPAILLFSCIGVYTLSSQPFDLILTALFGFVGYVFIKLGCEAAPLLLGFVLGPMIEENLRRAMLMSRGDPIIFLERPISLGLLLLAVALLVAVLLPSVRKTREEAFQE